MLFAAFEYPRGEWISITLTIEYLTYYVHCLYNTNTLFTKWLRTLFKYFTNQAIPFSLSAPFHAYQRYFGAYFAPQDSAMNELDVLRLENDTLRRKLASLDDKVRCIEEHHIQRRDKVKEVAWLGQEASVEVQQLNGILQRLYVRPRQVISRHLKTLLAGRFDEDRVELVMWQTEVDVAKLRWKLHWGDGKPRTMINPRNRQI